MRITRQKVADKLREHGYKLTRQRLAVIKTIASTRDHLTPATLRQKVHQNYPDVNIGLVTIYRTLELLNRLKLVCDIHTEGNCHSYTISAPGHHHHLICSNCDKVIDFSSCNLEEVQQNLTRETGFRIDSHSLEFVGLCETCQEESS